MARKRIRRRSKRVSPRKQDKAQWRTEDSNEMLAWLDYLIDNNKEGTFTDSILTHLKKECNIDYTINQVDRKLRAIWGAHGAPEAKHSSEIYQKGTQCLPELDPADQEEIRKKFRKLNYKNHRNLASGGRRLRSESSKIASDTLHHLDRGAPDADTPLARKRRYQSSHSDVATEQVVPTKRRLFKNSTDVIPNVALKLEHGNDRDLQPFALQCIADSEGQQSDIEDDTITIKPVGELVSAVEADQYLDAEEVGPARKEVFGTELHGTELHGTELLDTSIHRCCSDVCLTSIQSECENLQARIKTLQEEHEAEIGYFRDRTCNVEKALKTLTREFSSLESSVGVLRNADGKSALRTLYEREVQIDELQADLQDKRWLRPFSSLASDFHDPLGTEQAKSQIPLIGSLIKQVLSEYGGQITCSFATVEMRHDLRSLLCRSLGRDSSKPLDFDPVDRETETSGFAFRALVRSLIAAALCEWVFETQFMEISFKTCLLLEQYRSHLAKQDGDTALRNLDFAAHQSLIEEEFYQEHVIPRKAVQLADRLSSVLAPLFVESNAVTPSATVAMKLWSNETSVLGEIFERALRVKAGTIVSKDSFEVVLHPPGTQFDEDSMEPETIEGDKAELSSYKSPKVKICLRPAFYVHGGDRKIVEYNNFVPSGSVRQTKGRNLTKAVVVIEESSTNSS